MFNNVTTSKSNMYIYTECPTQMDYAVSSKRLRIEEDIVNES